MTRKKLATYTLMVACTCLPLCHPTSAVAASSSSTTVSGLKTSWNRQASSTVADTITISPATGKRTVYLQRYNSSKKKYITKHIYKTADKSVAKIRLEYFSKFRKRTNSKWRVYIPASGKFSSYVSPTIKITTSNLSSLSLDAKSYCIYRISDGKLLYRKKLHKKRHQASTTKVMTALLTIESGKLDSTATISKKATKTAYHNLNMKPGDRYRIKNLLKATLICSSNDGANALAESVAGSRKKFVAQMNARAKELSLNETHFQNAHGLDRSNHYTSSWDLARLTAKAWQYPAFRKAVGKKKYTLKSIRYNRSIKVYTTDAMLGYNRNFKGGKTGYTDDAGKCFTGIYKSGGETYVVVTLGSRDSNHCWQDQKKLHRYIDSYAASTY